VKFIIGLGNPGFGYSHTKHNIGFDVVKFLGKKHRIRIGSRLRYSIAGSGVIAGKEVTLLLPQTFMNLSGKAVGELVSRGAAGVSDILVVCDDVNIGLGRIRIRKQGSSGGHKGLESIIHTLQSDSFARLRVGIATETHKGDITGYVLSPFRRHERRNAAHAIELAADALKCAIKEGVDAAMSNFNKRKAGTS
jgi:PTH1 family peptidyl-tRNA hydrolase